MIGTVSILSAATALVVAEGARRVYRYLTSERDPEARIRQLEERRLILEQERDEAALCKAAAARERDEFRADRDRLLNVQDQLLAEHDAVLHSCTTAEHHLDVTVAELDAANERAEANQADAERLRALGQLTDQAVFVTQVRGGRAQGKKVSTFIADYSVVS